MDFIKRAIAFIKARYAPRGARQTFSTCGEDLIMMDILRELGIKRPIYIDIGAHHPVFGNNTYLLYRKGGHGVLVEPNLVLCDRLRSKRPRDICVNAGAGKTDGEAEFFIFEKRDTRSTFSRQQAEDWERHSGQKPVVATRRIISLDSIIKNYCADVAPDVVSIDAEGYDVEILSGFSWQKRPKLICIEAVVRGDDADSRDKQIYQILEQHGYVLAVQTRNNSIFVDGRIMQK